MSKILFFNARDALSVGAILLATFSLTACGDDTKTTAQANVLYQLPVTGQTKCSTTMQTSADLVDCTPAELGDLVGLGQDGEVRAGVANSYRLRTVGQETCVEDRATGLTWEVKTLDGKLRDANHRYAWYNTDTTQNGGYAGIEGQKIPELCGNLTKCDTQTYIAALNTAKYCGYSDWRLPTAPESFTITEIATPNTGIPVPPSTINPPIPAIFGPTASGNHWTGSSEADSAWANDLASGRIYVYERYDRPIKGNAFFVRAVRAPAIQSIQ